MWRSVTHMTAARRSMLAGSLSRRFRGLVVGTPRRRRAISVCDIVDILTYFAANECMAVLAKIRSCRVPDIINEQALTERVARERAAHEDSHIDDALRKWWAFF